MMYSFIVGLAGRGAVALAAALLAGCAAGLTGVWAGVIDTGSSELSLELTFTGESAGGILGAYQVAGECEGEMVAVLDGERIALAWTTGGCGGYGLLGTVSGNAMTGTWVDYLDVVRTWSATRQ